MALLFAALPTAFQGSTPEQTLQKFADAILAKDFSTVSSLVVGGSSDLGGFALFTKDDFKSLSVLVKIDSIQIDGKTAIAKVTSTISTTPTDSSKVSETVNLALQDNGGWKIVPPKKMEGNVIIGLFSYLATNPKGMEQMVADAKKAALSTIRLSNMKQIAIGLLIMMVEQDDVFPKQTSTLKKQLMPYVKNEELFTDPATKQVLPLFLNPALVAKSQLNLNKPAETPMLAWGKPGSLWFDERGYTYVAFCDGHVKRLDKAGAAKLQWKL